LIQAYLLRALVAAAMTSVATAVLGVYVVSRRLSSVGAALAHTALAGAVLGHLLGADPYLSALVVNVAFSALIAYLSLGNVREAETVIGLLFGFSAALAVTLVSLIKEYTVVAWTYLVGDVLGVSLGDIMFLAAVSVTAVNLVAALYKEFKFVTFDFEGARAMGLNAALYHFVMVVLIALVATVCLRTVGSILTTVLLVAPAAAARKLTHSFERAMALSVLISLASSLTGLYLSVQLNLATSGVIGLSAAAAYFVVSLVVAKLKYCKKCRLLVQRPSELKLIDKD